MARLFNVDRVLARVGGAMAARLRQAGQPPERATLADRVVNWSGTALRFERLKSAPPADEAWLRLLCGLEVSGQGESERRAAGWLFPHRPPVFGILDEF